MNLKGESPYIAIKITGGIGDYIIAARYVRDLQKTIGYFKFDVFCKNIEITKWIFGNIDGFTECHSEFIFEHCAGEYTVGIHLTQYVVVYEPSVSWKELKRFTPLAQMIRQIIRFRPKIDMFIARHPYLDGFLGQKIVYMNMNRSNFLHGMSKIAYGGDALPLETDENVLTRFGLTAGEYITVNNGFDAEFIISGKQATKCYPHFDKVVALLKQQFPHLKIVQIGTSTSIPIRNADHILINRTSLREAAGILRHARLHLDNEGGLVHVARCVGTKSAVIFGPTSVDYFAYEGNINIRPTFCGGCWWINETWMDQCPRGFAQARCMTEQPPERVADAVSVYLAQADAPALQLQPVA